MDAGAGWAWFDELGVLTLYVGAEGTGIHETLAGVRGSPRLGYEYTDLNVTTLSRGERDD